MPAYVLLGLYLINLGPLNIFPKIYPPISVKIQINSTNKNGKYSSLNEILILKTV